MPIASWLWRIFSPRTRPALGLRADPAVKWLPVIEQDACTGCGRCIEACGNHCLELVWDFATLTRPDACDGDGGCAEVCPEGIIRMDLVAT